MAPVRGYCIAWRESGRLNERASSPDQEDPGRLVQPEAALLDNTLILNMGYRKGIMIIIEEIKFGFLFYWEVLTESIRMHS